MRKPHWEILNTVQLPGSKKTMGDVIRQVDGAIRTVNNVSNNPLLELAGIQQGLTDWVISMEQGEKAGPIHRVELSASDMLREHCPYPEYQNEWMVNGTNAVYTVFYRHGAKIYKIARDFGEQLARVDLNLAARHLPTQANYCIEFPESVVFEDVTPHIADYDAENKKDYFHTAYVMAAISSPEFPVSDRDGNDVYMAINILLPCYDENQNYKGEENCLTLVFRTPDDSISDAFQRARKVSTHPLNNQFLVEYVLKCMIYINSGDPDLRNYRAPRPPETRNPKKLRRWQRDHQDHSMVDMILVGYNFKKPVTYSVNETTVSGHFRWQPFGPRRERVKLIWIEEHIRHYGEGTTTPCPTSPSAPTAATPN